MITAGIARVQITGNGSTTIIAFPHFIFAAAEVEVWELDTNIAGSVEVQRLTGFTVNGVGTSTGNVTYDVAPASGIRVTVLLVPAQEQTTDYVPNENIPADAHETQLDKIVAMVQDVQEQLNRKLGVLRNTLDGFDPILSTIVANGFVQINAAGDGITSALLASLDTVTYPVAVGITIATGANSFIARELKVAGDLTISNGTGVSGDPTISSVTLEANITTEIANAIAAENIFPSGTIMVFRQTAAPTGWTKDTSSNNDSALRIVTGSVSTGGSVGFAASLGTPAVTGTVDNYTLLEADMPGHIHGMLTGPASIVGVNNNAGTNSATSTTKNVTSTGGDGAHNHGLSSATCTINTKFIDMIVATKD